MSLSIRLVSDTLRQLPFGTIGVGYMGIGTEFDYPVWVLRVENLTNGKMMFSFNGIDDHFPLYVNGYISLDILMNGDSSNDGRQDLYLQRGDRLYVRHMGVIPTTGAVYVSTSRGA